MNETHILVVGAGPAGCFAALSLAPSIRVTIVDRSVVERPRMIETLPGAARKLLQTIDLDLDSCSAVKRWHVTSAQWATSTAEEWNLFSSPDAHGFQLERSVFDQLLRKTALHRGIKLLNNTRVTALKATPGGFTVTVQHGEHYEQIACAGVIDATGRSMSVARQLGAQRVVDDKLASFVWLRPGSLTGKVEIKAANNGWWYRAPHIDNNHTLAWFTDTDLANGPDSALQEDNPPDWVQAAYSGGPSKRVGPGWCCVGDASMSFDPLAAQGLFHAMYTGRTGALALQSFLSGDITALLRYDRRLRSIKNSYQLRRRDTYKLADRCNESRFWQRRNELTLAS